jgi:hypothetical protein
LIYRFDTSKDEYVKAIKYYSILLLIWTILLFGVSYLFLLPTANEENFFIVSVFSFQYLLIIILLICSLTIKKNKIRFLTLAAFLLVITVIPYILSLFSYRSGDDGPVLALASIFGFPMLASIVTGLRIFLHTRKIMERIY